MAEVKFCGLTREQDAALAVELGASYTGVIFAGGPRLLTPDRAREVLLPVVGSGVRRVGVIGQQRSDDVLQIAEKVGLDVLQLSYGGDRALRVGLRKGFRGEIWAVSHVRPGALRSDSDAGQLFDDGVDAVLLDAAVPGQLGGTGVALDWLAVAGEVERLQRLGKVVLAGGLKPSNVAEAIRLTNADVVDVSSGVESAPGIKDPDLMRAFARAAGTHEER